jgi:hypothetical protein
MTLDFRTEEPFYWYECTSESTNCRISQHDFVNRIRTSESTLEEVFSDKGLIALHGSLYSFYRELITKDFDVDSTCTNTPPSNFIIKSGISSMLIQVCASALSTLSNSSHTLNNESF